MTGINRRALLTASASLPLAACTRVEGPGYTGGWVGADADRGHRLRHIDKAAGWPAPGMRRRAGVLVVGAGIAGLAAARAFAKAGVDDVQVFDLEDAPGGNSRSHAMGGMACPLGAHYLPVPGEHAVEVIELIEELGLRRAVNGQPVDDERHLCHSPQERLFIDGHWHEGLLPPIDALPAGERAATLAQYRRFGALVGQAGVFRMPTARAPWTDAMRALDGVSFANWLDANRLDAPALRWYLDYCCRDDYGAGAARVSAWAGLHYFASRHGFHAPGDARDANEIEHDGVFTWPEGNAWLSRRLAAPLGERLRTGRVALRLAESRHEVELDVWNVAAGAAERWTAPRAVLAVPLFVAARLLESPPAALTAAAAALSYAPWLVANLRLREALTDHPGAPPSWDNVLYGSAALGYVDAMHQSTRPFAGPTVLTAYRALGGGSPAQATAQRARLLNEPWTTWAAETLADLATAHPDLPARIERIDLMRYGHAMSIPTPGVRGHPALGALAQATGRIAYAHADLSGYSVFEEALYHGNRVARAAKLAP